MSERSELPEEETPPPPSDDNRDVDAMGNEKRRQVVGQSYGPSIRKQLTVYGIFLAVLAVLVIGGLTVVSNIDNREMPIEDTAPWTNGEGNVEAPNDIDFPYSESANEGDFNQGSDVGAGAPPQKPSAP